MKMICSRFTAEGLEGKEKFLLHVSTLNKESLEPSGFNKLFVLLICQNDNQIIFSCMLLISKDNILRTTFCL